MVRANSLAYLLATAATYLVSQKVVLRTDPPVYLTLSSRVLVYVRLRVEKRKRERDCLTLSFCVCVYQSVFLSRKTKDKDFVPAGVFIVKRA